MDEYERWDEMYSEEHTIGTEVGEDLNWFQLDAILSIIVDKVNDICQSTFGNNRFTKGF